MRMINADALEKYLSDAEIEATRQRKYVFASALNTTCGNVRNFPTIEPERKKGEWKLKEHLWECDKCGCRINRSNPLKGNVWNYNFCPNCGADMRGEQDGTEK